MQVPNTGNAALNALVEMGDTEVSSLLDNPEASNNDLRNALVRTSFVVDALLAEIRRKNEFITFMLPTPPQQ